MPLPPNQLKAAFLIWLACTVNPDLLALLQAGTQAEIAKITTATGMSPAGVQTLVDTTKSYTNTHLLKLTGELFPSFLNGIYPTGTACDSIDEIVTALYHI